MADIARGRSVQDKDNVGGLRAAYFLAYDETAYDGGLGATIDPTTQAITAIEDLGSDESWYKYDLQGTSTADEALTASRENGTIFVDQTITLNLKNYGSADQADIYDLASGRYFVLIEAKGPNGNDGALRLFGTTYGCDVETGNTTSGAAQGDGKNLAITIKGMEPRPANHMDADVIWASADVQGSTAAGDINTGQSINDVDGTHS